MAPSLRSRKPTAPVQPLSNDALRSQFNSRQGGLKCKCGAIGTLVRNGTTSTGSPNVKCSSCNAKYSGRNLSEILLKTSFDGDDQSENASSLPTPTLSHNSDDKTKDELISQLRSQNEKLISDNKHLQDKVTMLLNQTTQLNSKIDQLISLQLRSFNDNNLSKAIPTPQTHMQQNSNQLETQTRTIESPTEAAITQPATTPSPSWSDVARQGLEKLPDNMKAKFHSSMKSLKLAGFEAQNEYRTPRFDSAGDTAPKPVPTAIYFANLPRGPIGALRRALLECLPKWSVLSISFIGRSITEILCHQDLTEQLISDMTLLGYKHLEYYSPVKVASHITDIDTINKYKAACYRRWINASERTYSPVSKTWYKSKSDSLLAENPGLDSVQPFQRRNETNDSAQVNRNNPEQSDENMPNNDRPETNNSEGPERTAATTTEDQDIEQNQTNPIVPLDPSPPTDQ